MTQLVENTLMGGALILAAAALRRVLKGRVHPNTWLTLWAVCLLRLLSPVSWRSGLSLYALPVLLAGWGSPAPNALTVADWMAGMPFIQPPQTAPAAESVQTTAPGLSPVVLAYALAAVAVAVWLVLSWLGVWRQVRNTIPLEKTDRRYAAMPAETVLREGPMEGAPLTFGAVRPTVVLFPGLKGRELEYVLAHEGVHARRRDNLWHYAMALVLVFHWFNPTVWLMAALLRRDVEISCDRAVLKRLGAERRAEYAHALVTLSTQAESPAFCRSFGPRRAEERIIAIMKYQKTTFAGIALALMLVLSLTVGFASAPLEEPEDKEQTFSNSIFVRTDDGVIELAYELMDSRTDENGNVIYYISESADQTGEEPQAEVKVFIHDMEYDAEKDLWVDTETGNEFKFPCYVEGEVDGEVDGEVYYMVYIEGDVVYVE